MKTRVFIDGSEGTTGLRIAQRLAERDDVQLMQISPELRKDVGERARLMSQTDIVFLCLPDDAARVAAKMALQTSMWPANSSIAPHRSGMGVRIPGARIQGQDTVIPESCGAGLSRRRVPGSDHTARAAVGDTG